MSSSVASSKRKKTSLSLWKKVSNFFIGRKQVSRHASNAALNDTDTLTLAYSHRNRSCPFLHLPYNTTYEESTSSEFSDDSVSERSALSETNEYDQVYDAPLSTTPSEDFTSISQQWLQDYNNNIYEPPWAPFMQHVFHHNTPASSDAAQTKNPLIPRNLLNVEVKTLKSVIVQPKDTLKVNYGVRSQDVTANMRCQCYFKMLQDSNTLEKSEFWTLDC